jgi:hypothetical protein
MKREVGVQARVQWRDPFGQFAREINEGAEKAAHDAALRGAELSRQFAPTGRKRSIVRAIKVVKGLRQQARWVVEGTPELLKIAAAQETGARPHIIESHGGGPLANKDEKFYAQSGRVRHPGNPAVHFMKRARLIVARELVVLTKKRMPNDRHRP